MAGFAAQLERSLRREWVTDFARAVDRTTDRLDRTVPVKTGALKRSRRVQMRASGNVMVASITYGQPYGQYLDEGVRPHVIRPRRARVLRFVSGGKVVYAKRVNHPGTNKHRGWFSRPTSTTDWQLVLAQVFR